MKPYTIKYRPLSFLPVYRTLHGQIPESWGELSASQLIGVASLHKSRITDVQFLADMMGASRRIIARTSAFERYQLMEYFEFLKTPRACEVFKISSLCRKSRVAWKNTVVLKAPAPKLKGVSFGQFVFADTYFSIYQKEGKTDDLDKFIASLYLPAGCSFSEEIIQKNKSIVSRYSIETREAIALNWLLIHEWLSLAYPRIFQKKNETDESDETRNPQPEMHDTSIWIKIFRNFVGDDILNDDKWAAKPVNTIFDYMTRKYKENARKK